MTYVIVSSCFRQTEVSLTEFSIRCICELLDVRPTLVLMSMEDMEHIDKCMRVVVTQYTGTSITIVQLIDQYDKRILITGNTKDYVRDAIFHPFVTIINS